MKSKILLLLAILMHTVAFAQVYKGHHLLKDGLSIQLSEGVLNVIPLSDKAIRIQWEKGNISEKREFILINKLPVPAFKFSETTSKLKLSTSKIIVLFDKKTGAINYADNTGKIFLREMAGSRKLKPDSVLGEPCFVAEQSFDSPPDESLFGLGQFQDGEYNLRNVTRELIQVNTQIAIPFLYSSRGYGILWHQYGLTMFNPTDNKVALTKKDTTGGGKGDVEVTTTSGTQKVSQRQSLYKGKFSVDKDGAYSFFLNLGDMESRHLLVIDGVAVVDESSQWLPPAVGKIINLKAGEHSVQVVCKASNTPKLSWKLTGDETTFRSPNAKSLDYVVFYGKDADDVITSYRNLSGNVPMLPLWAYGFWQCRERYTSSLHLIQTVEEFRKRQLPMDVIVQDWQYWGKYGWGVPKFDETNYPDPEKFIKELHDLNAHFSVSVWENLDKKSEVAKPYIEKNLYIPNSPWIDIYNPEARIVHWNALNTNLFSKGVDSWWMDATEPENDALVGKQTYFGLGNFYRLTYPLFVSKAVYDGQRKTTSAKRVTILTRSAFAGQQRYGTINWSGDIGGTWDSYKRQIVAGLNYSLTGMPYWTTDIGGFFRPGPGQYTDKKYHDLLIRWYQWGTFNPIFRIHGYQTETEPWKYGDTVESDMRSMLNLRYSLMPYIYSEAWQVSSKGSTIMRPLIMDFKDDRAAIGQAYEYMFGQSFLVAPIIEPGVTEWNVYLPKSTKWYDFWTGKQFNGGQTIKAAAPQDKIPLFVKAGSILPIGPQVQYAAEKKWDNIEIRIYPGADGKFVLYEDENDNYDYEKGAYSTITFNWNDKKSTLTISDRKGTFPGMLAERKFNILVVTKNKDTGANLAAKYDKVVNYNGGKAIIKL
ncbi:MAG TPA: TIM-barrel domain-containing protein [Hanamia sp.]